MHEIVEIAKALSDPGRVRILAALKGRELCVCQLVELLGLAASTVSKHMAILRQARLVEYRREGRWAYYRREGRGASGRTQGALRWLDRSLEGEESLGEERRRLERVLRTPVEELCRPATKS